MVKVHRGVVRTACISVVIIVLYEHSSLGRDLILTDRVGCYWAGTFSLSKNPDFGEEIGVEVLIKDENRQKILKTAEKMR